MIRNRLKQIEKRIREIWGKAEDQPLRDDYMLWLVRKQLQEIEQENFSRAAIEREVCDLILLSIKWLRQLGVTPKAAIMKRLETRHAGKTDEIRKKYAKLWREDHDENAWKTWTKEQLLAYFENLELHEFGDTTVSELIGMLK